jgi:hypothetical protein
VANTAQVKVDFGKENQVWHYLGRNSTDARPQYTEDPRKQQHNCKSNFLDSIPRPAPPPPVPRKSYGSTFSIHTPVPLPKTEKPYQYKPRDPAPAPPVRSPFTAQQFTPKPSHYTAQKFEPKASPHSTFVHHTPPVPRPHNYSTPQQPPPIPSPLPYYRFQYAQWVPPGQQAQRPQQTTQKPPSFPTYQPSQHPQQVTPQTPPCCTPQSATPAPQPQSSGPKPSTSVAPQEFGVEATCNPSVIPKQPSVSRRPSLPRPTPAQSGNGHSRNKSSVSSHSGRLALGSGQRFGTPPASYGHARGDSMTKSPFSHGFSQPPGLGPSPSPQNGQLFQAQARARSSSLVSNISLNTPMTSSAIRPSSSASTQALAGHLQSAISSNSPEESRPSVIQKYAFFQVHHNRFVSHYIF